MSPQNTEERSTLPCYPTASNPTSLLLVGDGLHALNPEVHRAVLEKDAKMLQKLAQQQLQAGANALAVNLGPGREIGQQTPWVVDTLQEVGELQLFFSANILQHHDVLKKHGPRITINAISANQQELQAAFQAANRYGCSVVVLLVQSGGAVVGIEGKLVLASEVMAQAAVSRFPLSRLYLDPVLSSYPDPVSWGISKGYPDIGSAVETLTLIKELDSGVKTIVALGSSFRMMFRRGNGSALFRIFEEAGVDAVLLNGLAYPAQEGAGKTKTESLPIAV